MWDRTAGEDYSVFARNDQPSRQNIGRSNEKNNSNLKSDDNDEESSGGRSDGEENKLAALNDMLKSKKFQIQREDEEDFEMFLQKLN